MQRLVLWDIDGTLLTGGGGGPAYLEALTEVFGYTAGRTGYSFAGKTDPQVAHDLLGAVGFEEAKVQAGLDALWAAYLRRLREAVTRTAPRALPGVVPLVERLERSADQVVLGLLTGNLREAARLKLEAAGIGFDRFPVGVFGSDHRERSQLPALAVRRAEALTGQRFTGKQVVIIGDTPLDVACGEHLGVRTVAVATGSFGVEELRATGADYVFPDLGDADAVWEALMEG